MGKQGYSFPASINVIINNQCQGQKSQFCEIVSMIRVQFYLLLQGADARCSQSHFDIIIILSWKFLLLKLMDNSIWISLWYQHGHNRTQSLPISHKQLDYESIIVVLVTINLQKWTD